MHADRHDLRARFAFFIQALEMIQGARDKFIAGMMLHHHHRYVVALDVIRHRNHLSVIGAYVARLVVDDPNVTSRASFLGAAASLFLQSPIFGVGIGGFAASGLDLYPHNMIAEVAVELGSIGILLFLAWFILALRGAARSPMLVALVVATSVYALFSGSLAGNAEFWMFSALAVAKFPISNNRRTQETLAVEHG